MSYEIPNFFVGVFPADIDMSTNPSPGGPGDPTYQYKAVSVYTAISTAGTGVGGAAIVPPGSTSSPMIGILQNNPQQGEAGSVMIQGVSKAIAAAGFQIGDQLMVNAAGAFLKATSTNYIVATALETAAANDVTTVLLLRNGKL